MKSNIIVIGGSFAGLTAAFELKRLLKDKVDVTVIARQDQHSFNIDRALRQAKIRDKVPVTFITAEPFLGHFGIGGMGKGQQMVEWFFKKLKIDWITNAAIKNVIPNEINLTDGRKIPYKFAIIIPPFKGIQAIRNSPGIGDERGFVTVNSRYQHLIYKNIYSAGVAVAVKPPPGSPTAFLVEDPKTGYMSQ